MALRSVGKKRQRGSNIMPSFFCWVASCAILILSTALSTEGRYLDRQQRLHQDSHQKEILRNEFIGNKSLFVRGGSDRPFAPSSANRQVWRPPTTGTTNNGIGKQSTKVNVVKSEEPFWSKLSQNDQDEAEKEQTKEMIDAFLTRDSRQTFITRVYAILTGQLTLTALSVIGFSNNRQLAYWFLTKGKLAFYAAMMVSVGVCLKMGMDPDARRKSPTKWQLLGIFTASEAFTVGLVSSLYGAKTLLSAFLATSTATAGITIYTLLQNNPKYDLSQWGSGLSSTLMVFFFYGLLRFFFGDSFLPMSQMLYSGLGAILFSVYLAYHTRLIVSGKHTKYQMNEKDYVYGAMTLYLDIINIFLRLVQVFDQMERRE